MTAPIQNCDKITTPAGQEQQFSFYILTDAIGADGKPTQVRQVTARGVTVTGLTAQGARITEMLAAIKALG